MMTVRILNHAIKAVAVHSSVDESRTTGLFMAGTRRENWETLSGIDLPMNPDEKTMINSGANPSTIPNAGTPLTREGFIPACIAQNFGL